MRIRDTAPALAARHPYYSVAIGKLAQAGEWFVRIRMRAHCKLIEVLTADVEIPHGKTASAQTYVHGWKAVK